jgi:hypothetical protein
MTTEELRKFNKETEQQAIELVKTLKWYQANKVPSKACVLVEDILPIIINYISKERLSESKL